METVHHDISQSARKIGRYSHSSFVGQVSAHYITETVTLREVSEFYTKVVERHVKKVDSISVGTSGKHMVLSCLLNKGPVVQEGVSKKRQRDDSPNVSIKVAAVQSVSQCTQRTSMWSRVKAHLGPTRPAATSATLWHPAIQNARTVATESRPPVSISNKLWLRAQTTIQRIEQLAIDVDRERKIIEQLTVSINGSSTTGSNMILLFVQLAGGHAIPFSLLQHALRDQIDGTISANSKQVSQHFHQNTSSLSNEAQVAVKHGQYTMDILLSLKDPIV